MAEDDDLDAVPLPPGSRLRGANHDNAMEVAKGAQLLQWRANGLTYAQMAEQGGYGSPSTARHALLRALDRHEAENAEQLRAIENVAYLTDQRALRAIISDPEVPAALRIQAVNARTRSAARHARMNGLDAPQVIAIDIETRTALEAALAEFDAVVLGQVLDSRDLPDDDALEG